MAVYPPQAQFRVDLPFTSEAPAAARTHLRLLGGNLTASTIDDAVAMLSELVTNAVQHGKPEITLQVRLDEDCVTVAVADLGEAALLFMGPAPHTDQPRGRGLLIVDALATRWGVSRSAATAGKTVWFELANT
jgi:anti-sigma regulatory factor (Ser/Thr protein kinase)